MHLNLLAKTATKLLLICILFLPFLYATLNFYLVFFIFLRRFLTLCMKAYYTAFIVYHLRFLGKYFRWFWFYCFSHLFYTCPLSSFWVGQKNIYIFKRKNSVGRKYYQLKVLEVLLMHLFVTLLINKTTGSDNQHLFYSTMKRKIKRMFKHTLLLRKLKKIYCGSDYFRMHYPNFI